MTIRHKFRAAPLDKGLSSDWNDDHEIDFTDELLFSDVFFWDALSEFWDISQCTGGGTAAIDLVSGHNFVKIESSVGAGDVGCLRLGTTDMTNKTDLPIATFTIKTDTIQNQEIGFFRAADTPFTANQNGAYFRILAGALYAVTGDGADEEVNDVTPATFNINKYYQLRIEFTSTNVRFYIDDMVTPVQTNTTHITTDDLTFKASAGETGSVSQILHRDAFGLMRLRKK